ncbi:hypothetical protein FB446DRAFT_789254 [Lentinula raphanica]|nr:hypothetical protein FB446DRAFT_789254 [Lentinula raphanica]
MSSPSPTSKFSPLRHNPYDSAAISSKTRPMRPLDLPSGSIENQSSDSFVPYPFYIPDFSKDFLPYSTTIPLYSPSTSPIHEHHDLSCHSGCSIESGSVPARSVLKQSNSQHAGESAACSPVSLAHSKRRKMLNMHPLLASSQSNRAPICYDVSRPPSTQTIVDQNTQSAIPTHTLKQPATDPHTMSRFVLTSGKFPWPVIVEAGCSLQKTDTSSKICTGSTSASSLTHRSSLFVSCADVLHAVHNTLSQPATPEEWEALGHGSYAQRKISRAYDRRCRSQGGGWDEGVRRVDWLGRYSRLIGIEIDKEGGSSVGNIVFGRS